MHSSSPAGREIAEHFDVLEYGRLPGSDLLRPGCHTSQPLLQVMLCSVIEHSRDLRVIRHGVENLLASFQMLDFGRPSHRFRDQGCELVERGCCVGSDVENLAVG